MPTGNRVAPRKFEFDNYGSRPRKATPKKKPRRGGTQIGSALTVKKPPRARRRAY